MKYLHWRGGGGAFQCSVITMKCFPSASDPRAQTDLESLYFHTLSVMEECEKETATLDELVALFPSLSRKCTLQPARSDTHQSTLSAQKSEGGLFAITAIKPHRQVYSAELAHGWRCFSHYCLLALFVSLFPDSCLLSKEASTELPLQWGHQSRIFFFNYTLRNIQLMNFFFFWRLRPIRTG